MLAVILVAGMALAAIAAALTAAWTVSRRFRPRLQRLNEDLRIREWTLANLGSEHGDLQARFQALEEHGTQVAIRLDAVGRPVYVSPSCRPVLGYAPAEILQPFLVGLLHPDDAGAARDLIVRCASGAPVNDALWRTWHQDGSMLSVRARCRFLPEALGVMVLLQDVTQLRVIETKLTDTQAALAHAISRDALTGLANRKCFIETLDSVLAEPAEVAVLFLDLDRFKPVNDLYGYDIGDLILREAASRLSREMLTENPMDPLIARLGDHEFAVLLRLTDGDPMVAARARDIIRTLADPVRAGALVLDVSATIGIAVSTRDARDAVGMLHCADIAMAHARQAGGGCYRFFEARMEEALARAEAPRRDLRAAIAAGEIVPYFQPLVRMSDTVVVGFEVLARWIHPVKGVLPPAEFLPLVEQSGLSMAMFTSVLTRSCRVARDWPSHIKLSVNISPIELQNDTLPDTIRQILEDTGFGGNRLEIEITENALIDDSRAARQILDRLRTLGLSVALDDFGTGFSSLYHLRELPFDKVKIDKSFMYALDTDDQAARYVAAIIGFGNALGLDMTAEGIEDIATLRRLQELGCTFGQGFLFGRPMPEDEAGRVLTSSRWAVLAAE